MPVSCFFTLPCHFLGIAWKAFFIAVFWSESIKAFRILIADDEPLIRIDLKELLVELGYEVVAEAGDGNEALELINQVNPDLAILDIKMPGIDGITLAREVSKKLPVIILTAYTERQLIDIDLDIRQLFYYLCMR